jgi:hypothetical protein
MGSITAMFSCRLTLGTALRNAVIGLGLNEFDISRQKGITLRDSAHLQILSATYNLILI